MPADFNAYREMVEFLTSGPSYEDIVQFMASEDTRLRVRYLQNGKRAGMLTPEEELELDEFRKVELFMREMKERARRHIPKD